MIYTTRKALSDGEKDGNTPKLHQIWSEDYSTLGFVMTVAVPGEFVQLVSCVQTVR